MFYLHISYNDQYMCYTLPQRILGIHLKDVYRYKTVHIYNNIYPDKRIQSIEAAYYVFLVIEKLFLMFEQHLLR